MQNTLGLGKLIDTPQKRDAIHIAIAPVVAAEALSPGQPIGFPKEGDTETVGAAANGAVKQVGVVDPYLDKPVSVGQRFWMFLYPNTVTSLHHEWAHPAFVSPRKPVAEQWLRDFAERCDLTYNAVLEAGREFSRTGDYFTQRDATSARDAMYENGAREEFWRNFEIVTGIEVSEETREGTVFSCSC